MAPVAMNVGRPDPVDSLPIEIQTELRKPVCSLFVSRAAYTNRQMTDAPTSEIAIGMKMSDFAARSPPRLSASTATARPSAVARNVTVTTHHRLLISVPRSAVNTPKHTSSTPTTSGAPVALPSSRARPVCFFITMATTAAMASRIIPMMNGKLVNMFVQFVASKLFSLVKTAL